MCRVIGVLVGRGCSDRWDEGGSSVKKYHDSVLRNVLPKLQRDFRVSTDAKDLTFGGSGLGGVNALCMAIKHPEAFANFIIDSPAFWLAEKRFLEEVCEMDSISSPHIIITMGQNELPLTSDNNGEIDKLLVENVAMFSNVLKKKFGT